MDGDARILLPIQDSDEMYKLTYDSDEGNEIEKPDKKSTESSEENSNTDTYEPNMVDKPKEDLIKAEQMTSPKPTSPSTRTKDKGQFTGNGRFYSLFANDAFLTEDAKAKKRKCGFDFKIVILVLSLVVMAAAIFCLMIVVKNLQLEQSELAQRITSLEASSGSSNAEAQANENGDVLLAPPLPDDMPDSDCCLSHKNQLKLLDFSMDRQNKRFSTLETKTLRHFQSSDVRLTEILRHLGTNSNEIREVLAKTSGMRTEINEIGLLANSAKSMATLALQEIGVDEEKYTQHMQTTYTGQSSEVAAFSVAHAQEIEHVISHEQPPLPGEHMSDNGGMYYDVNSYTSPAISFSHSTMGNENMHAESGVYNVPQNGKYVFFMNFCVQKSQETTVHLLRNDEVIRVMKVSSLGLSSDVQSHPFNSNPLFNGAHPIHDHPPLPPHMGHMAEPPPYEIPPLPPSDEEKHVLPHQFSELVNLKEGDSVYMKLASGNIVEVADGRNEGEASHSCTRFAGYKIN